ncbi:MAG TPA: serine/threonine-protein kinase [Polyangiaceae bacterium]
MDREHTGSEFRVGAVIPGTRYRVLGLLGAGGMGSVYGVEHVELGKRFVLKALLSDLALRDDLVARLRNEQRALGRLEHPNIVAVTDAGMTSARVPYFVMERLEGETLGARLRRLGRLSVVEALRIGTGVLDGLAAAHEIGVVHRDIKPQNVFLIAGGHAKILDFGIAKVAICAAAITARGVAIGTPRYMSPEQASGEGVDGRSDLYALGLVLFEAITGRGPFDDARDPNQLLLAQIGRAAPAPSALAPGVTRELDEVVGSLLSKDRRVRPPTALAAAAALRAVLRRYSDADDLDGPTAHGDYAAVTSRFELPPPEDTSDRERTLIYGTFGPNGTAVFAPTLTRTEALSALVPRRGSREETPSHVPVSPRAQTLAPIPISRPAPQGRARLAVFGAVLLAALGSVLASVLVRHPSPSGGRSGACPVQNPASPPKTGKSVALQSGLPRPNP